MNREISKKDFVPERGFKSIANKTYTKRELGKLLYYTKRKEEGKIVYDENKGCVEINDGRYYMLPAADVNGISLVFERKRNRRWGITDENRRMIFNHDNIDPKEFLDSFIEKIETNNLVERDAVLNNLKTLRDYL